MSSSIAIISEGKPLIRRRLLFFLSGLIILVTADLFIKSQVETHWVREWVPGIAQEPNESLVAFHGDLLNTRFLVKEIQVIDNFWSFTYVRNYNIGFSLLSFLEEHMSHDTLSSFLKVLQLIGLLLVVGYFLRQRLTPFIPSLLIISGGMGNVIDRWYRGYVVDYVKWYIKDSPIRLFDPWPIFNLADSMITVGVFVLIVWMAFFQKKESPSYPSNDLKE